MGSYAAPHLALPFAHLGWPYGLDALVRVHPLPLVAPGPTAGRDVLTADIHEAVCRLRVGADKEEALALPLPRGDSDEAARRGVAEIVVRAWPVVHTIAS